MEDPRCNVSGTACPAGCGYRGIRQSHHLFWSPQCKPVFEAPVVKRGRPDPAVAQRLFNAQLKELVGKSLLTAHIDKYMSMSELDAMRGLILACGKMTLDFIAGEQGLLQHSTEAVPAVESARMAYDSLPSVGLLIKEQMSVYLRAIPRTLGRPGQSAGNRGAVFFSIHTLLTILLQESPSVRKLFLETNERWKSGELYQTEPAVVGDTVHGSKFLNCKPLVGKATADEVDDARAGVTIWTDEFTPIDGLSQKARFHKYGAVLAGLLNLPPRMRHYADHLLLLALYNSRYSKQNGGLSRLLTGIGSDGKNYKDPTNLSMELELGTNSPFIQLPDVDDPSKMKTWRLRIHVLFISLDWLAVGDFGPFAGSVSARRPCWKCKWTASCPCAFIAPNDPRRAADYVPPLVHSALCKGYEPRTHASVIELTRELHELELAVTATTGKTRVKDFRTESGIFSSHSAAQGLLGDVVDDITPDGMHIFLCGLSRYLLSWCFDEWIGDREDQFTWAALNNAKNKNEYLKGKRVPGVCQYIYIFYVYVQLC
jgi:hypothetical protein